MTAAEAAAASSSVTGIRVDDTGTRDDVTGTRDDVTASGSDVRVGVDDASGAEGSGEEELGRSEISVDIVLNCSCVKI